MNKYGQFFKVPMKLMGFSYLGYNKLYKLQIRKRESWRFVSRLRRL